MVSTASTEQFPIGWRLRLLRENFTVFVYATHATQAMAFEWKPGLTLKERNRNRNEELRKLLDWNQSAW